MHELIIKIILITIDDSPGAKNESIDLNTKVQYLNKRKIPLNSTRNTSPIPMHKDFLATRVAIEI